MASKELVYRIGADLGDLDRKTDAAIAKTREWRRALREAEQQQRDHRAAIEDLGAGMLTFGAAVVAGLGVATKAAIDWESAFTGVRKTVDGSDSEIAALEKELRGLAKTLPATHEEIAGVAEAAGQLGIKRQDIVGFTKVMIDLGNTTNLTAEEAATGLAKFANIMGTASGDADRLGSALVALGNDGASTEADILAMALRIAGAGKTIGITEAQVLGFASALSSVGLEAEGGGSAISRVMISIAQATRLGGEQLDVFGRVAGMSGEQFAAAFGQDAAGAVATFIAGLGKMNAAGGDVFGTLQTLKLNEIEVRDALLRAAGASDLVTKSLKVGSSAWAENSALTEEANKRYETAASQLKISGNQIKDALIDVGAAIAPIFAQAADLVADLVAGFQRLPGPVRDVVTYVGAAAAGIVLVGGAAAFAAPKLLAFRESMRDLEATGGRVGGALGKFGLFFSGPWGAAIGAAVTLLGVFAAASGDAARDQQGLADAGRSVADAIREQNGVINESVRQAAAKAAGDVKLLDGSKSMLRVSSELGLELGKVTDAVLGQGDAYKSLVSQLDAVIEAESWQVRSSGGQVVGTHYTEKGRAALELRDALKGLHEETAGSVQAEKDVAAATQKSTSASREQADALTEQKRQTEAAREALDKMIEALEDLNGIHLSAAAAQRGFLDAIADANAALQENGVNLDITTEKGRANNQALDDMAKAAFDLAEAVARETEATSGSAAGQAAFRASLENSRASLINTAVSFGLTRDQAQAYADKVLGIPSSVSTDVALNGVPAAEAGLNNLARTRTALIQVQTAYGPGFRTPAGTVLNAHGNVVSFYAHGGHEDHAPQVVSAQHGTVRVWAEPETDRESYIPWAMDRRGRATGILRQTANGFGYDLVPQSRSVASVVAQSRHVDASSTFNGPVYFADYESFAREERRRAQHALFKEGVA